MSFLSSKWAPPVLIVLLAALAYWRVLQCGYIWDDDDYVTQNPVLRTWGGLLQIWFVPTSLPQYYPLVHTSFWLEYRIWGLWPVGYHLVNVILHCLSALVLLRLGQRLAIPGIWLAALWFLVHPVHVESVAWITERKNVLSLLCYLLAAGRWLSWHDGERPRHYAIGSLWLLAALWSKTVTASLPAALLLVVYWRDGRLTRRAVQWAVPWFVAGAVLGWFTVHLEATHVGAADAPWQLVGAERLLVAGRAVWFYAESLLWPFQTCFNYARWQLDTGSVLQWSAPIGAVLVVVVLWALQRRIGRGPVVVLLIFGGTLVPAIGFFDVFPFRYSFVADHFQYHASLALLVGVSALATRLVRRFATPKLGLTLAASWLALMVFATQGLVRQYRDFETLWRETLIRNPDSALAHVNLGGLATQRNDAEAARHHLQRCLELDPTSHEARINLGVIEQQAGNRSAARRLYLEALQWKPNDPNVRNNLAVLEIEEGNLEAGRKLAAEAIAIDENYYDARVTLGSALCELEQWQAAMTQLEWVLARKPDARDVRRRVVRCLLGMQRPGPAAANGMVALRDAPGDVELRQLVALGLARALQQAPIDKVREQTENACRNGGVDHTPILPLMAAELRRLGANGQADALVGRR